MLQLFLLALLLFGFIYFLRSYSKADKARRRRMMAAFLFAILFAFVLLLTITGRLHYIAAIVTGLIPFVRRALPLLQYVPVVRRFVKQRQEGKGGQGQSGEQRENQSNTNAGNSSSRLTRAQALQVLGLKEGASKEEIVDAHRRLMQRCHPDRGGNDFLAAQLNAAKDALLG